MRKTLLSFFAAIVSIAAFGQGEAYMDFNPQSGSQLSTRDTSIKVTLKGETSTAAAAVVQTVGSYGSMQYAPDPEFALIEDENGQKVINIQLSEEIWGSPYFEEYYLQVLVVPMTDEGSPIEGEDGDYAMGMANYTCTDTGDARLEMMFPNQQNIDNEEYTISQAYQSGVCTAYFSKEVDAENASGYLSVTGKDGEELAYADLEFVSAEWSEMDGLYKVDFNYIPDATFSEIEVAEMDITFEGILYNKKEMLIPEIVLFPASSSNRAPLKRVKSKLASEMSVTIDGLKVFNIQGNLVKDNASQADVDALPSGLYIVNGKKVLVK